MEKSGNLYSKLRRNPEHNNTVSLFEILNNIILS